MTLVEGATPIASRDNRRAIPVSCGVHGGPRGFTNLVIERKPNGEIVLDPHVTGECVIILDQTAAKAVFTLRADVAAMSRPAMAVGPSGQTPFPKGDKKTACRIRRTRSGTAADQINPASVLGTVGRRQHRHQNCR
jgi:hypothetical protein